MKTNLTKIGITSAIAAGAIICSIAYQSAVATPEATPLIDSDFDAAVGKFLVKRFCKRIGATPEQTTKLSALVSQTRESTRPEREQLREGALELSELYASDEATDSKSRRKLWNCEPFMRRSWMKGCKQLSRLARSFLTNSVKR